MGEEGQLNTIPCNGAAGERSRLVRLGLQSLAPLLVTAIRRNSQNKGAVGTERVELSTINQQRARALGLSPEHATPPAVQLPIGRLGGVITMTYTNAGIVGDKWPKLQFTTLDVGCGGCQ